MNELYSKLRYGYDLSEGVAKDLASSYEGIIWNTKAEAFFNELLGFNYSSVDYRVKLRNAEHEQSINEIKAIKKAATQDKFDLLTTAVQWCLLLSIVSFIGFHTLDALATNWVRITRDCTDTCHLDIR